MLEAYEIGISLALQDGVSAGIALIRRDLSALDQAIAATSRNLARLQDQAPASLPLSHAPTIQPRLAQGSPAEPPATPESLRIAPRLAPPTSRQDAPAQTPQATFPRTRSANPPSPVTPDRQPTTPIAPASPTASPPTVLRSQAPAQAGPRPATASAAVTQPALPPAAPRTDAPLPPGPPRVRTAPGPARAPVPNPVAVAPAPPPQQPSRAAHHHHAPRAVTSPTPGTPHRSVDASRPEGAFPAAAPPVYAAASPSLASYSQSRPSAQAVAPSAQATSFAPPAAAPPAITLQGDIILDGTRLGRWMTSSLARQAARPPAGPTGPDPRQTPLWSGQAQGF